MTKAETKHNACFVAGTLINTDKGMVPIQDIKVGDMVLSKPEDGSGEPVYKPVLKTFIHEDKEIWLLRAKQPIKSVLKAYEELGHKVNYDKHNQIYVNSEMLATPNHPIWVIGYVDSMHQTIFYPNPFWKRIDELIYGELITNSDGNLLQVVNAQPVYKFNNPSIENNNDFYWVQDNYHQSFEDYWHGDIDPDYWQTEAEFKADGKAYDVNYYINKGFVVGGLVQDDHQNVGFTNSLVDKHGDYILFTRNVYNIEVAGNHTYFVGYNGVWVHNKNCELVGFNEGTPLSDIVSNDRTVVKPGGDAMYSEIVKRAKNNTQSVSMACFVAGTLVHTDKGLVPIQDIKVGDMVLSRHENEPEGELAYKRVLSTFKSKEKEKIIYVDYLTERGSGYFFCTENHPFWIDTLIEHKILEDGKEVVIRDAIGWEQAIKLDGCSQHSLRTFDGKIAYVNTFEDDNKILGTLPRLPNYVLIFNTEEAIGVIDFGGDYPIVLDGEGTQLNSLTSISTSTLMETEKKRLIINSQDAEEYEKLIKAGISYEKIYEAYVYNIEVEDYHTYFVGDTGIWVRDKS